MGDYFHLLVCFHFHLSCVCPLFSSYSFIVIACFGIFFWCYLVLIFFLIGFLSQFSLLFIFLSSVLLLLLFPLTNMYPDLKKKQRNIRIKLYYRLKLFTNANKIFHPKITEYMFSKAPGIIPKIDHTLDYQASLTNTKNWNKVLHLIRSWWNKTRNQ